MRNLGDWGYREELDTQEPRYFGKYRGSVVNNVDLLGQGRLQVLVPDVLQFCPSNWALPCVPFAGPGMGMYVVPPPVGAAVWVEFEQGDYEKPIWVGCFWDGPAALPGRHGLLASKPPTAGTPVVTIETAGSGVSVSTFPLGGTGTVNLYSAPAASIEIGPTTITLSAPVVSVKSQLFSVNGHFVVI